MSCLLTLRMSRPGSVSPARPVGLVGPALMRYRGPCCRIPAPARSLRPCVLSGPGRPGSAPQASPGQARGGGGALAYESARTADLTHAVRFLYRICLLDSARPGPATPGPATPGRLGLALPGPGPARPGPARHGGEGGDRAYELAFQPTLRMSFCTVLTIFRLTDNNKRSRSCSHSNTSPYLLFHILPLSIECLFQGQCIVNLEARGVLLKQVWLLPADALIVLICFGSVSPTADSADLSSPPQSPCCLRRRKRR